MPQLPADWADDHFYLSPESSGIQGPWETHPIQRPVLNLMGNDDVRDVTIRKCARIGYTKMLMALIAYWIGHKSRSGVCYQPTDDDARDFMKTEINPMVRDVRAVNERLSGGGGDKQNRSNTLTQKNFTGSILHVLGGKSGRSYRRLTKDFVLYDELDGFDQDIDGEGDPVTLGDRRITASPFKKSIRGSTPAEAHDSIIQRTLDLARMVFDWHMRCVHCGELSLFQFSDLVWDDRDAPVHGKCRHCSGLWEWRDHRELCEGGKYLVSETDHPFEGYELDVDGNIRDPDGKLVDPPSHVGVRLWAGIGPFMSWAEIRDFFLDAQRDPLKLKVFVNTILGEAWEEEGERVEAEKLFYRRENWPTPVPDEVCFVTIGADVQDDRFEWQVSGWGPDEEHFSLDYRRLYARTDQAESWELFKEQLLRPVLGERHAFMPRVICIDSGHRADDVYKLCRQHPRLLIPVKGASDPRAPYVDFPRRRSKKLRTYLTIVGVNQLKSLLYARFINTDAPEGRYRWPRDDTHDLEYFQQLTAEEKRTKYRRGFIVSEWHKPSHQPNEVLDCNVYSYAAMRIAVDYFGQDFIPPPEPAPPDEGRRQKRRGQGSSSWLTSR